MASSSREGSSREGKRPGREGDEEELQRVKDELRKEKDELQKEKDLLKKAFLKALQDANPENVEDNVEDLVNKAVDDIKLVETTADIEVEMSEVEMSEGEKTPEFDEVEISEDSSSESARDKYDLRREVSALKKKVTALQVENRGLKEEIRGLKQKVRLHDQELSALNKESSDRQTLVTYIDFVRRFYNYVADVGLGLRNGKWDALSKYLKNENLAYLEDLDKNDGVSGETVWTTGNWHKKLAVALGEKFSITTQEWEDMRWVCKRRNLDAHGSKQEQKKSFEGTLKGLEVSNVKEMTKQEKLALLRVVKLHRTDGRLWDY